MSSTRSGVWTFYKATSETFQSEISGAIRRYPDLQAASVYFDLGMRTWRSEHEIGKVDAWTDAHEEQAHASLMKLAREDKPVILKLNCESGRRE